MWNLADIPAELAPGGVVSRQVLTRLGASDNDIRLLVKRGALGPLRSGWYAMDGPDADVVRAVLSGGVMSCVSALARWGVWRPVPFDALHTRQRRAGSSAARRGVLVCQGHGRRPAGWVGVDDPRNALLSAVTCVETDELVAIMESLVSLGVLTSDDLSSVLSRQPRRTQALLGLMAPAESGIESLVRVRLCFHGIEARAQVWLTDHDRVDLLIGRYLVVEVDGRQHHLGERFTADRDRDRRLNTLGYLVVRLTWFDVHRNWPAALASIQALISRGVHLRGLWPQRARAI